MARAFKGTLGQPDCPSNVRQRARYELVVATFLGTRNLRPVDDVARTYLEKSLRESVPARLQDASALLLYVNTAIRWGITSLTPAELGDWNRRLTTRVQDLIAEGATRYAPSTCKSFVCNRASWPASALWEADFPALSGEGSGEDLQDQAVELSDAVEISLPNDFVLADASRTLSAWTELMENLEETPLFPIQTLADILQLLVPLWSKRA